MCGTMQCAEVQEQLLNGERLALDSDLPDGLLGHVRACSECAVVLRRARRLEREWREQKWPESADSTRAAFLQRAGLPASPQPGRRVSRHWSPPARWIAAA